MKNVLDIKLANSDDIEFLEKCYKMLDIEMTEMLPQVLNDGSEEEEEHSDRYWQNFITRKNGFALIAYYNNVKTGMAVVEIESSRECHLEDLIVLPEYRGQGISKAIVYEAKRLAKLDGFKYMSLNVLGNNVKAKKLYEGHGFNSVKSWLISEL